MPTASNDDVSLHYAREGAVRSRTREPRRANGESVVFVSEAGLGGWSWGWQWPVVAGRFETIVWDLRGTGRSDAPPGPYSIETLADDLDAVLSRSDSRTAHVVGAGLGGAVALVVARRSSRVETLTLCGTAAHGDAFDLEPLFAPPDDPAALRRTLERALSTEFRAEQPDVVDGVVDWRVDGDATRAGWESQVAALDGFDATDWLVDVTQPALVIHGLDDAIVPPEAGRELASRLPRGSFVGIEGAGHLAVVERSREVNDRLAEFLETHADGSG